MYKRILTIQDISCVGQCSLTVALPILSACGLETAVLPSAVLSTHTAPGFEGFTFCDLSSDMPAINAHWQQKGITFDALYTGYLGSEEQIDYVRSIMDTTLALDAVRIVDPAMADCGKLYPGFDAVYAAKMGELCACADIILPNITEACLLTGIEYRETYDSAYIEELIAALQNFGAKAIVLTGVSYSETTTGVMVACDGSLRYYEHHKLPRGCHGTGDVFASAFTGAYLCGNDLFTAASIAADFTVACIENTAGDESHWYGVKFEPLLGDLIARVANNS